MKFTVTCDESNNGFPEELQGIVIADFRFEGVEGRVYRVYFKPKDGVTLEQLRANLTKSLQNELDQYPGQQVADEIEALRVRFQTPAKRIKR